MQNKRGFPLTQLRISRQNATGRGARRFRLPGKAVIIAALTLSAIFCVTTARLFIWPAQGIPGRVDAIVMLNGPGDRLDTALRLAWAHRAPVIVISRGSPYWGHGSICAPKIPGVRVICFDPNPETTQGEAEFAGRLARQYHWHSIALVATTPQDTRARIRVGRCFSGKIYVATAPLPRWDWPYSLAYEWGALIKALVLQRSC
jgi:hypothetical protein